MSKIQFDINLHVMIKTIVEDYTSNKYTRIFSDFLKFRNTHNKKIRCGCSILEINIENFTLSTES